MPKRDLVTEILQKRSRTLRRAPRYDHFFRRHDDITQAAEFLAAFGRHDKDASAELLKYLPIGIVACWESYFRLAIRDLIDFGQPFQSNAERLDVPRLELGTVLGVGTGRISVGEFVAHLVNLSSFEDICAHMTAVMGKPFLTELKNVPDENDSSRKVSDIAGFLFTDINEIFKLRHIYCHELATKVRFPVGRTEDFVGASLVFIYSAETVVRSLIGTTGAPVTGGAGAA
jgi:hypothetical protein